MIVLSFNGSDTRVQLALQAKGPQIIKELRQELDLLMLDLQRRIQHKLSGEVLHQRTGKLLGSVNKQPTTYDGQRIVGRVTAAAGPAFYGHIHEKGGTRAYDIYPTRQRALAFNVGGRAVVVRRVHHPPLPKRSFAVSSLNEMRVTIISRLRATAGRAVRA